MTDEHDGGQPPLTATAGRELTPGVRFAPLTDLGEKIFLDRYALKDASKATLAAGDLVVVCTDTATGQREVGTVLTVTDDDVAVRLRDGTEMTRSPDSVDKPLETSPEQMVARVARGIAAVEPGEQRAAWEQRFRWLLSDWRFVPGGRILTAAGTDQQLTFYNCYVIPSPRDSRHGIVDTLSQMMEIMSRGGGVGINISSLRPRHAYVRGVNGRSSGAVSWGALYSFVTGLIEQGGSRRGALMLICDVWHPDVMEFIGAKREMGKITNANISVGVTDAFMEAVRADGEWQLAFPDIDDPDYEEAWNGDLGAWKARGKRTIVHRTVRARQVWETLIESAWASAEPGLWFRDRAKAMSNSGYYAPLVCTNPCGEQPLPEWSVCNLGAINLGRFARDGGAGQEGVAWDELATAVRYAVRFLDDVVDATPYFFDENEDRQRRERRIGLGTMGLAELLIRLGLRYGSEESLSFLDRLYRTIAVEAYHATAELAAEKGSFPAFEADRYLDSGFMRGMPEEVRAAIRTCGARNVTLLTQAPTGTTGTMVDTSTGIEPYFSWSFFRKGRLGIHEERAAVAADWERDHPGQPLPDHFVTAMDLTPEQHVRVMATIQRWVDSSISKTCNVPADYTVQQTRELYELMYDLGCKGGTIYRDRSRDEQVLNLENPAGAAVDAAPASTAGDGAQVRPLPQKRFGATVSSRTPVGTAHVTMNDDEDGNPLEVFVEIGRGGSELKAMAEAMGRLMSVLLRMVSALSPKERVAQIVDQLRGIGGSRSTGYGTRRVRSLPDAVAQVLAEHYGVGRTGATAPAPTDTGVEGGDGPEAEPQVTVLGRYGAADSESPDGGEVRSETDRQPAADLCPECGEATLVHAEGCQTCSNCGHSEC